MAKKDFSNANTNPVYSTIAEATAAEPAETPVAAQEPTDLTTVRKERKSYTEAEKQKFLATMQTTGRKGVKLPRINLAFTPENYDYIKTMAAANGENMTALINSIIDVSRERNMTAYQQAKANKKEFIF